MNDEYRQPYEGGRQTIASIARASRRRLLALLAALPAVLSLAAIAEPDASDAKKKGKHKKKKKNNKNKNGGGKSRNASYSPDSEELALIDLINDFRERNGAGSLALHERLGAAAEHHSQDMAKKNYFSHKLSNGDSPAENIRSFGYSYRTYGENIAAGYETAADTFAQWENSAGHRKNMLSKNFNEIGIGRAFNQRSKYDWYWTADFGSR